MHQSSDTPNCVVFDAFYSYPGNVTWLNAPTFSLVGYTAATLTYSLIAPGGYAQNQDYGAGSFGVYITTNGGTTWTEIQTNPTTTGNNYVTQTVDLTPYVGNANCIIQWDMVSNGGGYGNAPNYCTNEAWMTNVVVSGTTNTPITPTYTWSGPGTITSPNSASTTANAPGTYTLTTGAAGCTATNSVNIPTPQIAAPVATANPANVCTGNTSTISFGGLAPGGYVANFATAGSGLTPVEISGYPDNFTEEFWVLPNTTITMPAAEAATGTSESSGEAYAIAPATTGSATLSAIGVSVGTNGVRVFENSTGNLPALLVYNSGATPLNGWTHIAVVYTNKTPSLYINGTFVTTGLTITMTHVYPSVGTSWASYGPFTGKIDNIRVWNGIKSQNQILADMFLITPVTTTPAVVDEYTFDNQNANDNVGSNNLTATSVQYVNPAYYLYSATGTGLSVSNTSASSATTSTLTNGTSGPIFDFYNVTASTSGGCSGISTTTAGNSPSVTVEPNASITGLTGTSPLCPGGTAAYTATMVLGGGSVVWSSDNTNVATVDHFGNVTAVAGGTCNIIATISGGCGGTVSASQPLTVTAVPLTPGSITSSATTTCPNTTGLTFSIAPVAGATTYTWTVPTGVGWTITNGQGNNSITVTAGYASGNVSVTAGNTCGNSAPSSISETVSPAGPATPDVISGSQTVCPNVTGQVYSVPVDPNATSYNWTLPSDWVQTGGGTSRIITATTGSANPSETISVTASNSCGTSSAQILPVAVDVAPSATISESPSVTVIDCNNPSISLSVPSASSYLWSTTATGQSINVSSANTYKVTVTGANSCTALGSVVITSNTTPSNPSFTTGTTTACLVSAGNVYTTQSGQNNYVWSITGGTITSGGNGSNSATVTWTTAGNQSISVNYANPANGCSASSPTVQNVVVANQPQPGTINPTPAAGNVCTGG